MRNRKLIIVLMLLLVIPFCSAFKPITHFYIVYNDTENKEMALGALLPDISEITEGRIYQNYLHGQTFLADFNNIAKESYQRNFFQGYYHHTKLDIQEDFYATAEKKQELAKLNPGFDNYVYEEAISYAVETLITEKDPSIINRIVNSLEQQNLLDYYAQILKRNDAGDKERVAKQKQNMLIYLSAMQSRDYELLLEEETKRDLPTEDWDKLVDDAITICKKDDVFKFLEDKSKNITIPNYVKPEINPAMEQTLDTSISDTFLEDEEAIMAMAKNYDDKILEYIQKRPEQIMPLAIKLITTKPMFVAKLLLTTKSGLFVVGMSVLILFLFVYATLNFIRRSGKDTLLGMPLGWIGKIHKKLEYAKGIVNIPKIIMYFGLVLFTFSLVYDLMFGRNVNIGYKQLAGIIAGILIILAGFFFTGHSKAVRLLPENVQLFAKAISYLILTLGLLVAVVSVFYDYLIGKSFFFGIKQFMMLLAGILLIFVAYLMKR